MTFSGRPRCSSVACNFCDFHPTGTKYSDSLLPLQEIFFTCQISAKWKGLHFIGALKWHAKSACMHVFDMHTSSNTNTQAISFNEVKKIFLTHINNHQKICSPITRNGRSRSVCQERRDSQKLSTFTTCHGWDRELWTGALKLASLYGQRPVEWSIVGRGTLLTHPTGHRYLVKTGHNIYQLQM